MTEASYPYVARRNTCRYNSASVGARITRINAVSDIRTGLASGPVSVLVQAESGGFMYYSTGIFNGVCGQPDHAVIAVGWGTAGGVNFLIVRNSWGGNWGERGYIRVRMGGSC